MRPELEALLLAYDAWFQAGPDEAERCQTAFEACLEHALASQPCLARERLLEALRAYYPRWIRAREHPPTMPPKA